jgi:hypothetical protein
MPGVTGALRLDAAMGLIDRHAALSAGYVEAWGR